MATVLIADDDPNVLETYRRSLERTGYEVLSANDGKEALDLLGQNSGIAIVVTDEGMPEISGTLLLELARQRGIQVPFILVGGYVAEDRIAGLKAAGFSEVFCKPIDVRKVLISAIERILAQ